MSNDMKILVAVPAGGLFGFGAAAVADNLGMSRNTANIISYVLWAVFAVILVVSLVRRRHEKEKNQL